MIAQVRIPYWEADPLGAGHEQFDVRDPSLTHVIGQAQCKWDGDFMVVTIELDDAVLRSRLRERRGAF